MKTTIKQITAGTFIALLLLAGNVNATETKASSHEATETALQLENWMVDETLWNNNTIKTMDFTQETESSLELEGWMTNDNLWNLNNNFVEETEANLELESWMTSDNVWDVQDMNVEPELTLENWMINSNIWE